MNNQNKTLPLPSQEELINAFEYNPTTGEMSKKSRTSGRCYKKRKYQSIYFNGIKYLAHRIAWKIMTGLEPVGVIDHINNDQSDNRWENLQDIPEDLNRAKDRALPIYPPGYYTRMNKWVVRGRRAGTNHYKSFDTELEATAYAESFRAESLGLKAA